MKCHRRTLQREIITGGRLHRPAQAEFIGVLRRRTEIEYIGIEPVARVDVKITKIDIAIGIGFFAGGFAGSQCRLVSGIRSITAAAASQ